MPYLVKETEPIVDVSADYSLDTNQAVVTCNAGISIVQLTPETIFRHEKSDMMDVMRAIIELSRGHSESAIKSDRLSALWEGRRQLARQGSIIFTRQIPAWVEILDGKLVLIPDRAKVVSRIFAMARDGMGLYTIMKKLTEEKVPGFGPSGRWSISYLHLLLSDRRVLGEFQPRLQGKNNGKPDGDPIPDYFPRVVSDEAFERARRGMKDRWRKPGRIAEVVNVFQGLIVSARDGLNYTVAKESSNGRQPYHVLRSVAPRYGQGGRGYSFPLQTFEQAIFTHLREIDPHDILNGDAGPDETIVLSGELSRLEASIATLNADMDEHGESPALMKRVRDKEVRQKEVLKLLNDARKRAANPLSESWGEAQDLMKALKGPEARLRLRSALRRYPSGRCAVARSCARAGRPAGVPPRQLRGERLYDPRTFANLDGQESEGLASGRSAKLPAVGEQSTPAHGHLGEDREYRSNALPRLDPADSPQLGLVRCPHP
jgi:hypothetical protein